MGMKPVKVSQLNSYIKRILQSDPLLGNISVRGEVSNLKFNASGNVYLSLKDETSRINCFIPASSMKYTDCMLREGIEVIADGYIYLYEPGGRYSLNIRNIEAAGQGDLAAAFEKLKNKLEKEGMFDQAAKKPLPFFPEKVAVVTSGTGAAVRDIVKIITSKNDYTDILIYPVTVQGVSAAHEISSAIRDLNENHDDIDIIITGRGGGSMEELWAFNEEIVARSIFESDIPVISAVGHETDFTIADFVADLRAETPTAAAERAVPDTHQLAETISRLHSDAAQSINALLDRRKNSLRLLDPMYMGNELRNKAKLGRIALGDIISFMDNHVRSLLSDCDHRLAVLKETIDAANPDGILKKGYSMLTDGSGRIITETGDLHKGQVVDIRLRDGTARARIEDTGRGK